MKRVALACVIAFPVVALAVPRGDELTAAELAPDCRLASSPYPGSLHAATSYEVPMLTPKSKSHQSIQCGKSAAAIYYYVHDKASIATAAAGLGARLWGGAGPTAEHSDELLVARDTAIVVSGPARPQVLGRLAKKGYTPYRAAPPQSSGEILAELEAVLRCDDPNEVLRAWCPATALPRSTYRGPTQPEAYLGLLVRVRNGQQLTREVLQRDAKNALLVLAPGKISVRFLDPSNDAERGDLLLVTAATAAALKGSRAPIAVKPDLAAFVRSQQASATKGHPIADSPSPAVSPAPSMFESQDAAGQPMRGRAALVDYPAVGKVYVAVQVARDFTYVSVFPVVPITK